MAKGYFCRTIEEPAGSVDERLHVLRPQMRTLVGFSTGPPFDQGDFRWVIDILRYLDRQAVQFIPSGDASKGQQVALSLFDEIWKQSKVNQNGDTGSSHHIVSFGSYRVLPFRPTTAKSRTLRRS
jgi:hypothetical protein